MGFIGLSRGWRISKLLFEAQFHYQWPLLDMCFRDAVGRRYIRAPLRLDRTMRSEPSTTNV
jgi:hypothetical protein